MGKRELSYRRKKINTSKHQKKKRRTSGKRRMSQILQTYRKQSNSAEHRSNNSKLFINN